MTREVLRQSPDKHINSTFQPVGAGGTVHKVTEEVYLTHAVYQSSYRYADPGQTAPINITAAAGFHALVVSPAGAGAIEHAPSGFCWHIPIIAVSHANPTPTSTVLVQVDGRLTSFTVGGMPLGRVEQSNIQWAIFRNIIVPSNSSLTLQVLGWTAGNVNIVGQAMLIEAGIDPWFGGCTAGTV